MGDAVGLEGVKVGASAFNLFELIAPDNGELEGGGDLEESLPSRPLADREPASELPSDPVGGGAELGGSVFRSEIIFCRLERISLLAGRTISALPLLSLRFCLTASRAASMADLGGESTAVSERGAGADWEDSTVGAFSVD